MPLYEYKCLKCGRHTEKIESVSGPHLKKCPHCGGKVDRLLAAPAIQFKGAGWYVTDYASKSKDDSRKEEQPVAEAKDASAREKDSRKDSAAKEASAKETTAKEGSAKETKEKKSAKKK